MNQDPHPMGDRGFLENKLKYEKHVKKTGFGLAGDGGVQIQKKYEIFIVPTIIVFDEGKEVKRFQADLSFQMVAKREEVQEYIDELIISKF